MNNPAISRPDQGFRCKFDLIIGRSPATPADVASTITGLAEAIEIIADDAELSGSITASQRVGAILGIARCILALNAELPEILDELAEKLG